MARFSGKTILVTGGTSGIGLATARLFAQEGGRVLVTGRSKASIETALAHLPSGVVGEAANAGRPTDLDALANTAKAMLGHLDVLVLSAGVMKAVALADATEADFDEMFGVNVKGVFFAVQKLGPLMRPSGSIVLVGSGAAEFGRVGRGLYAASKAAVRQLARSLAAEMMHRGVRVNVVSPGPILTPLNLVPGKSREEQAEVLGKIVPMGRAGEPEEVAAAIAFLCSSDASFITGAELPVDGGWVQLHAVPPKS